MGLFPFMAKSTWWWLAIGTVILEIAADTAQKEKDVCPDGWISHKNSCYSFMSQRSRSWRDALNVCNASSSAHLVSINSVDEERFLAKWLRENDFRRQGWWTSAYVANNRWEWAGDGSKITFYAKGASMDVNADNKVAYVWKDGAYVWTTTNEVTLLAFICELPLSKIFSYNELPRLGYGLDGADSVRYSYGPKITTEPSDLITYANGPRHSVELPCKARSFPAATYRWIKASTGQEITPSDSAYIINDGTLIIRNVSGKDFGSYYCETSNGVSVARSRTASFSSSYVKEFPKSRLDVYGTEGSGKSISCEAPPHFPQSLSFAWMYETVKNFLHESSRIFISSDGTLHFSYLTQGDQKKYACSVVIPELHTGYYGPFFALKIDQQSQVAVPSTSSFSKPVIPDDFLHIYPSEPRLGASVWIECFAYGKPTPTYRWTRVDKPLSDHAVIKNFGRRLYFPSLQMNDTGTYRCIAENEGGTSTKEINLVLQVAPILVTPPADVVVEAGGLASFTCDVFGVPRLDYEWFHNGKPLNPLLMPEEDQGRIAIEGNKLIVEDVQERDAGIYQCHASNSVGEIGAAAELVIRNVAPTFSKQISDLTFYATAGKSVRLPCRAEALPIRKLTTWTRDNVAVSSRGGVVLANGDLIIENVDFSHAGRYTCAVENNLGVDSISFLLSVLPQLTVSIQSRPLDTSEEIECISNSESTKHIDEAQKWTFNCHKLNLLEQFQPLNAFALSSISSKRISIRKGNYFEGTLMCRVDTVAGHASSSIEIERLRVPIAPIKVFAHNVSIYGVYLSWEMPKVTPSSKQGSAITFGVEAKIHDSQKWKRVQTITGDALPSAGHLMTGFLLPYSRYQFRVFAENRIGKSAPSTPSNVVWTPPGPPFKAITNLRTVVLVSGEILVQWKGLQKQAWGAGTIGYIVQWHFSNSSSNFLESSVTISNADIDHHVIQAETQFCSYYEVNVLPFNEHGRGPPTAVSLEPYVFEVPFSQPSNVSVNAINSSAVSVGWNKVGIVDQPCQRWIGIKVFYWPVEEQQAHHAASRAFPAVKYVHRNQSEIIITDLISSTTYAFQLAVFNINGDGPRSPEISVTTNSRGPRLAPSAVSVSDDVSDGHLVAVVRWSEVEGKDIRVLGYKVHLFQTPWTVAHVVKVEARNAVDWQPVAELDGLTSFQGYKLCINAFNEGGDGPLSDPVFFYLGSQSSGWSIFGIGTRSFCLSMSVAIFFWRHLVEP